MGAREHVHRFATTVAPALAATHAPLALGQMPLRAAIGAGRVNALASGQRGKGFQPEINPGLLPSGRQGAHRYVGTRNGDIPAVSFTRDGDGLGVPSSGRDQWTPIRPIFDRTREPLSNRAPLPYSLNVKER